MAALTKNFHRWREEDDDSDKRYDTLGAKTMESVGIHHRNDDPRACPFVVSYATSHNGRGMFNLKRSIDVLGYEPRDDAEVFFSPS